MQSSDAKSLEQARRVALSHAVGEGDYGVRKRSFRTPKTPTRGSPSPTQWERGWG